MQLIQIFLNPFISSLFLCKLVQLFCFLLSFWDQSGSFTFLSFLISSRWIFIFFPPLFHCCLSEKEVQLKCLFDGEIGSVVFVHFFFFKLFFLSVFFASLCPSSSPFTLSVSFFFPFVQRCFRGRLWQFLLDFSKFIQHPCIPFLWKRHQNHLKK